MFQSQSTTASQVWGQNGAFNTNSANGGVVTQPSVTTLNGCGSVFQDAGGNVWIADVLNHRVVQYAPLSTTGQQVWGQSQQFTTQYVRQANAASLNEASGAWFDQISQGLYVADTSNNRVLFYSTPSTSTTTTASRVYGQRGNMRTNDPNAKSTPAADTLYSPSGVVSVASGVYIADSGNNRILFFSSTSTVASRVYGQSGSFTSGLPNNGGVTASSLNTPDSVAVDQNGNLYVSDTSNNRVLYYAAQDTTASRVYGQGGQFTTNAAGTESYRLFGPTGIHVTQSGLFVADTGNSRIVFFAGSDVVASRVIGQQSMSQGAANGGGAVSASSLYFPMGVYVNVSGVYVADTFNNRVLFFEGTSQSATVVYGQQQSFTTSSINNKGLSASSLYYPIRVAASTSDPSVYISDTGNSRVLVVPAAPITGTTTSSGTTTTPTGGGSSSLSGGAIAGIVIGSLVAVVLLVVVVVLIVKMVKGGAGAGATGGVGTLEMAQQPPPGEEDTAPVMGNNNQAEHDFA